MNKKRMKMKIKFNWGTGIIIASLLFMAFTVITGITLMNQKVDLVTDNYYEKELKYQKHIDKEQRTKQINSNIDITQTGGKVSISFRDSVSPGDIKGEVKFYRPSDSAKDFAVPLSLNQSRIHFIDISGKDKGYWKVQVNWSENNNDYYFEKPILIN
jgi:hypothetical protein